MKEAVKEDKVKQGKKTEGLIDKKAVTLEDVYASESFKDMPTAKLKRNLETAIQSDHPDNVLVQCMLLEMMRRGEEKFEGTQDKMSDEGKEESEA